MGSQGSRFAQPGQLDLFNLKGKENKQEGEIIKRVGVINSTERKIVLNRGAEQNLMRF